MKQTLLIPRAIAEWIEYCKSRDITLYGALEPYECIYRWYLIIVGFYQRQYTTAL